MSDLFDLTGKVAIITGGAGLLAGEHATALSNHGATVIMTDVNKEKCDEVVSKLTDNINAISKYCDVTSSDSWKKLLDEVMNEFEKVDILINNAGFTNQSRSANFDTSFENFPLEDWNTI